MATITTTRGYTFGATELVTNTKLHTLIDSATSTISGIVGSELASGASIVYTQLAQIGAASMVCGSAFWGLATIPAAAGIIPSANLPTTSSVTTLQFDNGDLSSGDLVIASEVAVVEIRDNNGVVLLPDSITRSGGNTTVALDSYGSISGTWEIDYI